MRKTKSIIVFVVMLLASIGLVSCASESAASDVGGDAKMYLTQCALPGDGSGLMPGTFVLPNGTKVVPGSAILEGSYIYATASAKVLDEEGNIDYPTSSEQAHAVCRDYMSSYVSSAVSATSGRSNSASKGVSSGTKSGTESVAISNSILKGMEDCGYVLDGQTTYILTRINTFKGTSKNLLFENACGFSRQKNGEKHRNTVVFRGFLPVLWPERRQADSDSEVFRSALNIDGLNEEQNKILTKNATWRQNVTNTVTNKLLNKLF